MKLYLKVNFERDGKPLPQVWACEMNSSHPLTAWGDANGITVRRTQNDPALKSAEKAKKGYRALPDLEVASEEALHDIASLAADLAKCIKKGEILPWTRSIAGMNATDATALILVVARSLVQAAGSLNRSDGWTQLPDGTGMCLKTGRRISASRVASLSERSLDQIQQIIDRAGGMATGTEAVFDTAW